MKRLQFGFTYNVRHAKPSLSNKRSIEEAEFDDPDTIKGITSALESLGHTVYPVEADQEAYSKLKELQEKLDLVFNYAEGICGQDREAQIPAILEMLRIPYTGGSPLSYALGLNKAKCKEIWSYHNIPTPKWQVFQASSDILSSHLRFPLLAKPTSEGSSKGIYKGNLVHTLPELTKVVTQLLNDLKQPVLVEEYLPGREFTVGVLGTPPAALPIIEVRFDDLPEDMPKFDHYEAKWIYDSPEKNVDPLICPASINTALKQRIEDIVLRAFEVLEMKDWARFDIRLDSSGNPHILEVNCPPGIIPDPKENSRFPRAARVAGYSFPEMLNQIIQSACKRYQIT